MIPVFFNQNYIYMTISEAKEFITSQPNKDEASKTYARCWMQFKKNSDKVKLERWWTSNHEQLKFYHSTTQGLDKQIQGEKEIYKLILTDEQTAQCEQELAAYKFREDELDLFIKERLS
jgi:hypothetical protein